MIFPVCQESQRQIGGCSGGTDDIGHRVQDHNVLHIPVNGKQQDYNVWGAMVASKKNQFSPL